MTQKHNTPSPSESSAPNNISSLPSATPLPDEFTPLKRRLEAWALWVNAQSLRKELEEDLLAAAKAIGELGLQRDDALLAASRFARELADLRISLAIALAERERLEENIRPD